MNRKSLLQRKDAGFAISVVLIAFVILIAIGVGLLNLGLQGRLQAVRAASEISAKCAADSGLTKALFEMNKKLAVKPWSEGALPSTTNERLPNSDATFSYAVTGNINSGYVIESIGKYGRVEKTVRSVLHLAGLFEEGAVFTIGSIQLKSGTVVDSYNNDAGDGNILIGTDSTAPGALVIKNGVIINGDIAVGAGGDPDVVVNEGSGAEVTGEIYPITESYNFPSITVPDYLTKLPKSTIKSTTKKISSDARFDSFDLSNGQIIQVDQPVTIYVSGNVNLDNAAQLDVVDAKTNPNASLTMYVGGDITSKNGSFLNNFSKDSKKFQIFGLNSCKSIDLMNGGQFYGAIYAPNADIKFRNSVDVYGSVMGKSFIQMASGALHYNASLSDAGVNDIGAHFEVTRWYEE